MVFSRKIAAVLVVALVLGVTVGSAQGDANYLPLDGSDTKIHPQDFGYKIETFTVNEQIVLQISLAAKAVKSFASAELTLTKGNKSVLETTCGLTRLPDSKGGIIKVIIDPRAIDGGQLTIASAPIKGVVPAKNFAGFRLSIDRLLKPAQPVQKMQLREVRTVKHDWTVTTFALSHDGKRVFAGSGTSYYPGWVEVWDVASGKEVYSLRGRHDDTVNSLVVSADGKSLITGSGDKTVKVWDAETGQERAAFKGHTKPVFVVAVSPDGKRIVSGAATWWATEKLDGELFVWEAATGKRLHVLQGQGSVVYRLAISPDGALLASGHANGAVIVWNLAKGTKLQTPTKHVGQVTSLTFTPDGEHLLSTGLDKEGRDSQLIEWDVQAGKKVPTIGESPPLRGVVFSPDGKLKAHLQEKQITLTDAKSGKVLAVAITGEEFNGLSFSGDGKYLASRHGDYADMYVRVWAVGN